MLEYNRQYSLAEGVLSAYNGKTKIPTKMDPVTGAAHPYDAEYDFTSRFPLGFNGCFTC